MQINTCTSIPSMRTATINVLDEYTSDLFYSDNCGVNDIALHYFIIHYNSYEPAMLVVAS